jgi:hypothetical protein
MSTTNSRNPVNMKWEKSVTVDAQPKRIAAGGVVHLTAEPEDEGTYDVDFVVEGPERLSGQEAGIALLGATTVSGGPVTYAAGTPVRASFDTGGLAAGNWIVRARFVPTVDDDDDAAGGGEFDEGAGDGEDETGTGYFGDSNPIEVLARPFQSGDDVSVTLRRTAVSPTADQALWVAIRNSTNALSFDHYSRFMDRVMCGGSPTREGWPPKGEEWHGLRKTLRKTALPFPNVDPYRLVRAATETFMMVRCGVDLEGFEFDLEEEHRRLGRAVTRGDLVNEFRAFVAAPQGDVENLSMLPYLRLIRQKLGDVPVVGFDDDDDSAQACYGILAEKLTNPCFIELLWSYWHERGGLPQSLNAILWRFQNRTLSADGRDPLAGLNVDPLRPMSNLLWGVLQDSGHRLTAARRLDEYLHLYGLGLGSRTRAPFWSADARSRFIDAFHNLLSLCSVFYRDDDNTTVIADGFGVLNALREVHLLLSEGAHNQYGDLPWTARHEMLVQQWVLGQPQMREVVPNRTMVALPERWMDTVESMNRMQGWTENSVLHFRDLGVFGEQILLGIRFGAWTEANVPDRAANFARYWRAEIQGYIHALRAVTGVNLSQRGDRQTPATAVGGRQAGYSRYGAYRG